MLKRLEQIPNKNRSFNKQIIELITNHLITNSDNRTNFQFGEIFNLSNSI